MLRRTDSYFGIVSSAHEAHALIDAAKLGVRRRFLLQLFVRDNRLTAETSVTQQLLPRVTRRLTDEE